MQRRAHPGEINGDVFDRFTVGHAAVGVILGLARAPWWVAIGTAVGWELVENSLKDRFPRVFPHATHDHPWNAIVDAASAIGGWAVIRSLPRR